MIYSELNWLQNGLSLQVKQRYYKILKDLFIFLYYWIKALF